MRQHQPCWLCMTYTYFFSFLSSLPPRPPSASFLSGPGWTSGEGLDYKEAALFYLLTTLVRPAITQPTFSVDSFARSFSIEKKIKTINGETATLWRAVMGRGLAQRGKPEGDATRCHQQLHMMPTASESPGQGPTTNNSPSRLKTTKSGVFSYWSVP